MNLPKFKAKRKKDGKWVFGDYGKAIFGYVNNNEDVVVSTISTLRINEKKEIENECWEIIPETLCQFTGIIDKDGVEIYSDDIRISAAHKFRIYAVSGGFAVKSTYWANNISDLTTTDEFVLMPIAEPQLAGWLKESTKAAGNYHDLKQEEIK